jgi:ABC-2 type transport system permease protein
MLRRIWRMVVKEFIQLLRDRRMKGVIFGAPIMQMLLFGYAVTMDVNNIRTAIYDGDNSYESREIVRRMTASGYFTITRRMETPREADGILDRGEATMSLIINHGFSADIKSGKPTATQILVDGTDSNTALIAISYAARVGAKFSRDMKAPAAALARPVIVEAKTRAWYNPDLKSRNYNVPGVIAILVMLISLLLTSMAVVREREIGTMEQLMVTPLTPVELILGKTIPFAIIGFFDMALVSTVAVYWYEIPIRGSLILLTASTGVFLLSSLSFGLFISTIARTQQQAMMATFLFFAPFVLLSGFIFPADNMPVFFQWVTLINPLRHFLVIIRGIFLKGMGLDTLWPQELALLALGLAFLAFSAMRFRKKIG